MIREPEQVVTTAMLSADWVTLIFLGEVMLVLLVVCTGLFVLLRRYRRQIDQMQSRTALLTRRQISQFLDREIAHTRDMARRSAADPRLQPLAQLRLQWLQLEQRALQEDGDRRSDFALLERSARPLLAMIGQPVAASTGVARSHALSRSEHRADDTLKQARATILLQKEIITGLKQQLKVARTDLKAPSAAFSAGALD
jgi:ATP-dependent Clp protease ATP-binding subunit ClpA